MSTSGSTFSMSGTIELFSCESSSHENFGIKISKLKFSEVVVIHQIH